jgi:hypothetical protein
MLRVHEAIEGMTNHGPCRHRLILLSPTGQLSLVLSFLIENVLRVVDVKFDDAVGSRKVYPHSGGEVGGNSKTSTCLPPRY